MWTAVVTVLLTFLFTGFGANRLIQAWQLRNWISQQRLADAEKEHQALQDVFDEVATLAGRRQHKMMRLLSRISSNDEDKIRQRLVEYDVALVEWNERLNAIFAKLTIHLEWRFTSRLERGIQGSFVSIGEDLEQAVRRRLANQRVSSSDLLTLRQRLHHLQGQIFAFNRDILRFLNDRKSGI